MTREELLKIAKPILFNTEMVRAINDGRKTVTRRVAFPNKDLREYGWWYKGRVYENWNNLLHDLKREKFCKYQVGDYLYVRETWARVGYDVDSIWFEEPEKLYDGQIIYLADFTENIPECRWHPSIHMPKEAARIFLRVTNVRVERLQDITHSEIAKEGIVTKGSLGSPERINPYFAFKNLWDSTIKKSNLAKYGWDANPWVWVVEFERVEV